MVAKVYRRVVCGWLAAGLALSPALAFAQNGPAVGGDIYFEYPEFTGANYTCDRDVQVPAVYVGGEKGSLVVLTVEGMQLTLLQEAAASGVRYGWPSGGSNYVWWTKGDEASLYWSEPGKDLQPIYNACKANS